MIDTETRLLDRKCLSISCMDSSVFHILTDYFSLSDDEELMYCKNLIALKVKHGIIDNGYYHYDIPLTVKH